MSWISIAHDEKNSLRNLSEEKRQLASGKECPFEELFKKCKKGEEIFKNKCIFFQTPQKQESLLQSSSSSPKDNLRNACRDLSKIVDSSISDFVYKNDESSSTAVNKKNQEKQIIVGFKKKKDVEYGCNLLNVLPSCDHFWKRLNASSVSLPLDGTIPLFARACFDSNLKDRCRYIPTTDSMEHEIELLTQTKDLIKKLDIILKDF